MKQLVVTNRITSRDTASFNLYLKDIYSIEVLTPAEETALAIKANNGDQKALDELIRRNLRFVISVAKVYANANNPLEDLVNEGNIGLIKAANKFKPEMGWKFISYAVWWIQKLICEHLAKNGRMVRLPSNKINSLSKLDKKISALEQRFGRNVDIAEIINEFGDDEDYEDLGVLSTYSMDSLDREIGSGDESSNTLGDLISDTTIHNSTDQLIMDAETKSEVARIINTLKPREKRIITVLFGIDGTPTMTLKELGAEMGVTREMIRQIKVKTLATLAEKLKDSSLRSCQ
jgi:RNA polymerase primary sigma factor